MKIRSLRNRIVGFFVFLLVAVQVAGFFLINHAISTHAQDKIRDELESGDRIFQRILEHNTAQLSQAARVLAADFGFREALATQDRETLTSALSNHGERIGAKLMLLVDPTLNLVATSAQPQRVEVRFADPALIRAAEQTGSASTMLVTGAELYQMVVVPVLAPQQIAWLAVGFAIDGAAARDLARLTLLDVSFLYPHNGGWRSLASTLAPARQTALAEALSRQQPGYRIFPLDGEAYQSLITSLAQTGGGNVVAVLQRSLQQGMQPFEKLQATLVLLCLGGLAVSVAGAALIARNATRPIVGLARIERLIEEGNYQETAKVGGSRETGEIASAFDHMRHDISEISEPAYKDTLTALPNRTLFNDRLQQAINASLRETKPLAVLMLDLDDFKDVNDTLGYQFGDALLRAVAERLECALHRKSETIARLGGDEFAVLLPVANVDAAQVIARKLLDALAGPFALEGQSVDVKGSVGIACCPLHGADASALMRKADIAMYTAKRNSSGFAVYDASQDQQAVRRLSLFGELKRATELDQLLLHYQPGIEIASGRVTHMEALVRWQHPERGLTQPDEFVPFAEGIGVIDLITRWVLDAAFRQSAAWTNAGFNFKVAVNISARDLLNPDLVGIVAALGEKHLVQPQAIRLEITESAIMVEPARALGALERLHWLGFTLCIDDFGTGYSSLAHLKSLPVDELKIDKSFVIAMTGDREDAMIVRSTIDLGHNMGMAVVAEGVETDDALAMLGQFSCDVVQGFFISRPLPVTGINEWLRKSWNTAPSVGI